MAAETVPAAAGVSRPPPRPSRSAGAATAAAAGGGKSEAGWARAQAMARRLSTQLQEAGAAGRADVVNNVERFLDGVLDAINPGAASGRAAQALTFDVGAGGANRGEAEGAAGCGAGGATPRPSVDLGWQRPSPDEGSPHFLSCLAPASAAPAACACEAAAPHSVAVATPTACSHGRADPWSGAHSAARNLHAQLEGTGGSCGVEAHVEHFLTQMESTFAAAPVGERPASPQSYRPAPPATPSFGTLVSALPPSVCPLSSPRAPGRPPQARAIIVRTHGAQATHVDVPGAEGELPSPPVTSRDQHSGTTPPAGPGSRPRPRGGLELDFIRGRATLSSAPAVRTTTTKSKTTPATQMTAAESSSC